MQKILTIGTETCSLRSKAQSWEWEDGDFPRQALTEFRDKYNYLSLPVGLIRTGSCHMYPTVLHAIGDGWKLLAPPEKETWKNDEGIEFVEYSWWLVRD